LQESKVIFLEDLASHFGLRTQEAIDRVQDLLNEGILTGTSVCCDLYVKTDSETNVRSSILTVALQFCYKEHSELKCSKALRKIYANATNLQQLKVA